MADQQPADSNRNSDATISRNARPSTDDEVVEAIDEDNPGVTGSPRPDSLTPDEPDSTDDNAEDDNAEDHAA